MIDKIKLLSKIKKIELKSEKLVKNHTFGKYSSLFRGRGVELDSIREYSQGDDVRDIDWKSSARSDRVFVKQYREDKNIDFIFLIDLSTSMKREEIIESIAIIFASVALTALSNEDKVGAIFFTDKVSKIFPIKKSKAHIMNILDQILSFSEGGNTDINGSLEYVIKNIKKRSVIFVISDFLDDKYEDNMKRIEKRHRVFKMRISDRRSNILSKGFMFDIEDSENYTTIRSSSIDNIARDINIPTIYSNENIVKQLTKIMRCS